MPLIVSKLREWRATSTKDGFRIHGNPDYDGDLRPIVVTAAYGQLSGRKFSSHEEDDFSFVRDRKMLSAHGAELEPINHNMLKISPTIRDFAVEISGFDRRRALDYQVVAETE